MTKPTKKLLATLATARLPFHIDVNVGDPIWPAPARISIPRLLGGDLITLTATAWSCRSPRRS